METETRLTGPQIRAARGLLGISQPALATASDLTRQTVSTLENRDVSPPGSGGRIASAFLRLGVQFSSNGVRLV